MILFSLSRFLIQPINERQRIRDNWEPQEVAFLIMTALNTWENCNIADRFVLFSTSNYKEPDEKTVNYEES